jgi:hypothetical protein
MISIFKIGINAETSEIGYYPQVQLLPTPGWDRWGKTSVSILPLNGIILFRPQFPRLGLEKFAKCTDIMSTIVASGKLLMISEKLYKVFTHHLTDAHQCFTEPLETPQGKMPYLFLYLNFPRDEVVFDWPKCVFFDVNDPDKKPFSVPDTEAFHVAGNGKVLKHQQMVLQANQPVFDLFMCWRFKTGARSFYVTSQMKEAIETEGITGIRFEEITCLEQEDL